MIIPCSEESHLALAPGRYLTWAIWLCGKTSGAQFNPSVTWSFFTPRKIEFIAAVFYTIFEFIGAVLAATLLKHFTGYFFSHPDVDFGVTGPKSPHIPTSAFIAELIISFTMLLVVLAAMNSKRINHDVPQSTGVLICLYLVFETPFSGVSLNPARSFAGDMAAKQWLHLWIYFVAPPLGMIIAALAYQRWIQNSKITEVA